MMVSYSIGKSLFIFHIPSIHVSASFTVLTVSNDHPFRFLELSPDSSFKLVTEPEKEEAESRFTEVSVYLTIINSNRPIQGYTNPSPLIFLLGQSMIRYPRILFVFSILVFTLTSPLTLLISIFVEPFDDEIHPRLRFPHRGIVAMANNGAKNSNDSQFFITLGE